MCVLCTWGGDCLKDIYKSVHILSGKTIYSFGDSLLYGHYSQEGILDGFCSKEKMVYTKYAVNGAAILNGNIEKQLENASDISPDFVIFDGMMNDSCDPNAYVDKLGNLADSYDENEFRCNHFLWFV